MVADRRLDRSARYKGTMSMTASRRLDRGARSMATRVWTPAPIMWRRMKSILSHRRRRKVVKLQDVAKQEKSWGLRSCRMMQGWSLLPSHIVATILSFLPVKSLVRFRCVCKEWRSLTYNPSFVKEHHARARALGRLALVSTRYSSSSKILLYDFGGNGEVRNQEFDMRFGDLNGYHAVSNPVNGLICIKYCHPDRHGESSYYLLNPVTRELAKLPNGNVPREKTNKMMLGFDSSTGGYKLVEFFCIDGRLDCCGCNVLELGTEAWREVGRAPCRVPNCEPVILNGDIHWISCRINTGSINVFEQSIVTFNLKDEKFRSIPVPTQTNQENLAEWEGLLCIVKVPVWYGASTPGGGSLVRIWRLEDYATCRWREAHCSQLPNYESIGGQLYLVGIRGHEMLLVLRRAGLSICWYDLRTRSLREIFDDCPHGLRILTESLVSPRYLAGNLSLH